MREAWAARVTRFNVCFEEQTFPLGATHSLACTYNGVRVTDILSCFLTLAIMAARGIIAFPLNSSHQHLRIHVMATMTNIDALAAQPEPWGSPLSYAQSFSSQANVNSSIAICLPKKEFDADEIRILTQDPMQSGVSAEKYDAMANSDVTLSTYDIQATTVALKTVMSGDAIPKNKVRDLKNSPFNIYDFYVEAHKDAVRAITERDLVLGDSTVSSLEMDGFLATNTPRHPVAASNASALNRMGSIDEAAAAVKSGAGMNRPMIAFCHSSARSKIARDIRVTGGTVTSRFLPPMGKNEMVVETASGPIWVVVSDFFPFNGSETSIILASLGTELGVCMGVPRGTPEPHESDQRDILRPQGIVLVEYKRALLVSDSGKLVEITGYDINGAD